MILVDTSVFIHHFRKWEPHLAELLEAGEVLLHPWVLGELTLGHLGRDRQAVLRDFALIPPAPVIDPDDVIVLIEREKLHGSGIGWIDAQLLASARVCDGLVWSFDRALERLARRLRVAPTF